MPFGLRNPGQTSQRFIDHVTRGLDFVFVYLDDLLVTSPDHKTHKKHLKILFKRLTEYGIITGPDKCYVCPEGCLASPANFIYGRVLAKVLSHVTIMPVLLRPVNNFWVKS